MPLLRAHLLRLDVESRRDRFNGAIDERFIESYAERCVADGTVVIAYVEDEQVLAADLRRANGVAGDADNPILLAEQIERLHRFFGQAHDAAGREVAHADDMRNNGRLVTRTGSFE
jgi:hypothetical protein